MSDNPIKFPRSPSSSEDDLPTHHSSEEDISSDEWMSSDHIPLWSSKKEDPEEEEEDEDDANADAEDDDDSDDDSDDSDSDSNFALPPLIYLD
jgi:hypothetical protein